MLLCQICAESFSTNKDLNDHAYVHNCESTFCEECGKISNCQDHFTSTSKYIIQKETFHVHDDMFNEGQWHHCAPVCTHISAPEGLTKVACAQ